MPDESKKNQKEKKGKNEPKDQRKPKQFRHNNAPPDKAYETPSVHKVVAEPSADFYKGLKRETDEILKITEENNAKYKKKEIKSNWEKYEMPIDSYDDVDEQENMGADYERLMKSSMSSGGHFQFKHEKSWDSVSTATEYDKFFNIYTDDLAIAVCSIPFYERIGMDISEFSEMDICTMNSRATKYMQKYYNDKSHTTPELEVSKNILETLKESLTGPNVTSNETKDISKMKDLTLGVSGLDLKANTNPQLPIEKVISKTRPSGDTKLPLEGNLENILAVDTTRKVEKITVELKTDNEGIFYKIKGHENAADPKVSATAKAPIEVKKSNETPEDLEKWLDDFLDG